MASAGEGLFPERTVGGLRGIASEGGRSGPAREPPRAGTAGPRRRAEPPSRWNSWGSAAETRAVNLPEMEGRGLRPRPQGLGRSFRDAGKVPEAEGRGLRPRPPELHTGSLGAWWRGRG